jgi:hypothetical protein
MSLQPASDGNDTTINRDDLLDTIRFFISVDQSPFAFQSSSSADDAQCRHQHIQVSSRAGSDVAATAARRSCLYAAAERRRTKASIQDDLTSSISWQSALIRLLLLGVDVLLILRRLVRLYFRLSMWRPVRRPHVSSSAPYTVTGCRSDDEKTTPVIGLTATCRTLSDQRSRRNHTVTSPTTAEAGKPLFSATSNGQHPNNSCGSGVNGNLTTTAADRNHSPLTPIRSADSSDRLGRLAAGMEFCQIGCYVDTSGGGKAGNDDTCKSPTTAGLARFYEVGKKNKSFGNCYPMSACCCCCCSLLTVVFSGDSAKRRREPTGNFESNGGVIPRLVVMAALLAALFYMRTITSHAVADGGVLRLLHGGVEPTLGEGRDYDDIQRKSALDDVIESTSTDLVHLQSFVEFLNNGWWR